MWPKRPAKARTLEPSEIEARGKKLQAALTSIAASEFLDEEEKESLKKNAHNKILDLYRKYLEWCAHG